MSEKEAPLPPLPLEWEPLRRSAPKVGRNDPCPCGSGKKYKKCCEAKDAARGSDLSPFAGMTKAEALADPGRHGDVRVVEETLTLEQLDALETARLTTPQVQAMAARAGREGRADAASRALAELDGRADAKSGAHEYRCDVVSLLVRAKAVETAEAELAKVPAEHPRRAGAELAILVARRAPEALERLNALLGVHPDEPDAFIDAAYSLHDAGLLPLALGLLRATPVDVLHVEDARQLALEADDIRKALELAEGDPVLDPALVAFDRAHPEAELAGTKRALEERERTQSQLDELKAALAELHRERAEAERALARAKHEAVVVTSAKRAESVEGEDALRRKLEQLKAEMREQQRERAELRERLREAEARAVDAPAQAAEPIEASPDDSGEDLPDERPVRAVVFSPLFHDTARTIDPKVALKAQDAIVKFATYDASAWHQAKKMRDLPDVFTLRVGIHHRVILRRSSDGGVEARELVTREAFDATLRGYRR